MSIALDMTHARSRAAAWRATLLHDWDSAAAGWRGEGTVFQSTQWLAPFYGALKAHVPDASPLIVRLQDGQGSLAYQLPLVLRRLRGARVLEFADLGMTDFNAPLLGPSAPRDPDSAVRAWTAVQQALPPCDLVRFIKMPGMIGGRRNPLLLPGSAQACAVNGNLVAMTDDWPAFHFGLERTVRKELERSWRVFARDPLAGLHSVATRSEALDVLHWMEQVQSARMREIGQPYTLDDPVTADFYRRMIAGGIETGYARITLLRSGAEIVAALLGVRDQDTYVMIRLVHSGGAWAKVSPGRMLIHKTLELLHGEGVRNFDFSVGNYAYKRRFGPVRIPLFDHAEARSLTGVPLVMRARAAALLRRHPRWHERARRLMGKPPSREES